MARLYANENFPLPVVEALRRLGHTIVTARESGKADQSMSDQAVLDFARSQGMALLTLNRRHFIRLHKQSSDHAGIVTCTFDPHFATQAQRIHAAIEEQSSLDGKLLRVNRPTG